ncbi:hypothetical protein K3495_g8322 [Podosphaera aphanis]|nr:hypothetical protein K3495_g8322 [Podosphaera aphanis]
MSQRRRDCICRSPKKNYDAVLGIPWLQIVNPDIDWQLNTIRQRPPITTNIGLSQTGQNNGGKGMGTEVFVVSADEEMELELAE